MRCPVCDATDWKLVDQYRIKPEGMSLCNKCGFVSYPNRYKSPEEIREYYKKDYRPAPKYNNLVTGIRKTNYHKKILYPLFKKWKDDGIEKPVIGEIGAAYGITLDFLRKHVPGAELYGTEWAESYVLNAFHEYGFKLTDELDENKKYDLIVNYRVLEHQMDADKMLIKYRELLSDNGYLYLSVPVWFEEMQNPGLDGFDIEYYYHPDHINVWTEKHLHALFKKAGLAICIHDDRMYGHTFLLKKCNPQILIESDFESPSYVEDCLNKIWQANLAILDKDFASAIKIWPNFPWGHYVHYEMTRSVHHKEGQQLSWENLKELFIDKAMESCSSVSIYRLPIDLAMRYNHYDKAIEYCDEALKICPDYAPFLSALSTSIRTLALAYKKNGKNNEAIDLFKKSRDISRHLASIDLQYNQESVSWIYHDNAQIPLGG